MYAFALNLARSNRHMNMTSLDGMLDKLFCLSLSINEILQNELYPEARHCCFIHSVCDRIQGNKTPHCV